MKTRPLVFLSAVCFATICLILCFPKAFLAIFTAILGIAVACSIFLITKKQYLLLGIFVPVMLFSAINPYLKYVKEEKRANEFIESIPLNTDTVFTATVEECRTYSSFSQIYVTLDSVDGVPLSNRHKARLGCYSGARLKQNDTVAFSGTPVHLEDIEEAEFDTSSYLRSKSVFIDFPSVTLTSSYAAKHTPFLSRLRSFSKDIIYTFIPRNYNYDTAAVSYAMFAGDSNFIPSDIKECFSDSGLTHVLCVSGMHLAIISGSIYFLLSALSVHKKVRCMIIIVLCILYTAFTGFSLSTIRACIMCTVSYFGMMIGRKTDGYLSLFLSLLLICTFSPYSVLDISLILSFSATLGIIIMSELAPKYEGNSKLTAFLYGLIGLLFLNLGAVFFTLPFCAFFFNRFSLVSAISTLAVSAAVNLLLISLLLLFLISPLSRFSAAKAFLFGVGGICDTLCKATIGCAKFFSSFRYSAAYAVYPVFYISLFVCILAILTVFIIFDIKRMRKYCLAAIIVINTLFSFITLSYAVFDDIQYKVTYFRKNKDDRQISVKLGTYGYFMINADSSICTDSKDIPFDKKNGVNYLFILPDDAVSVPVLADDIRIFNSSFGIRKVFVPQNDSGILLANRLYNAGIRCFFLPCNFKAGRFNISYSCDDDFYFSIDDSNTKTGILISDSYSANAFEKDCDICAFFTENTENQFNTKCDTIPECSTFFTRLKKDETARGIVNTFGQKTVTLKG